MPRKPKDQNDELAKVIGQQITHALERLNITLTELHRRTGISRTVLLAYTRGDYAPGARELKLLSEHLDTTPNVLMYGSNVVDRPAYRLGDMDISKTGADVVAFLCLLSGLTALEKTALLTIVDGLVAARNPEQHRAILGSIEGVIGTPGALEGITQLADQFADQHSGLVGGHVGEASAASGKGS